MTEEQMLELWHKSGGDIYVYAELITNQERKQLLTVVSQAAEKAVDKAMLLEREECAKICEYYEDYAKGDTNYHATLIRARGQE